MTQPTSKRLVTEANLPGYLTAPGPTKDQLSAAYAPLAPWAELVPLAVYAHSWAGADTNATPGARIHDRVKTRLRMGTVTNNGLSGCTIGDLSMLALAGSRVWTPPQRAFIMAVCTINDVTIFRGSAVSRRGYAWAWGALLSRLTAVAVRAANTSWFSYSANWVTETVATSVTQAAANAATGGVRFKTTTAGSFFDYAVTGDKLDMVFIARAGGAGLVTATVGGSTVGTLDLTSGSAQDCPAVLRLSGLGAGSHTVRFTLTSGTSMTVDSALIPSTTPPAGIVLGEPQVVPSPTDAATYWSDVQTLKGDLPGIVAGYPSMHYLDLNTSGWDPASMLVTDANGGHKHPNDAGAYFLAAQIVDVMRTLDYAPGTNVLSLDFGAYTNPAAITVAAGGQAGNGSNGVIATSGDSQVILDYSGVTAPAGLTDWSIQYRTSPAGTLTTVTKGGTGTTFTVTGLTNGTAYDLHVAPVVSGTVGTYTSYLTRTPAVVYATEDFTAADSAAGLIGKTSTTGAKTWALLDSATGATWGISTNRGYCSAGGNSFAVLDVAQANVRVRATVNTIPGSNLGGVALRCQDGNNGLWVGLRDTTSTPGYTITKRVAGQSTALTTTGILPVAGDLIELVANGTTVQLYVNGALIGTASGVTDFQTATKHGLYGNVSAGGGAGRWDDLAISSL